ncbi:TPR repeat-containing protein [Rivularia sp. IAM M-261]|nr:TPR repeat-containing protein [Rivularia sp. IAM M-261]
MKLKSLIISALVPFYCVLPTIVTVMAPSQVLAQFSEREKAERTELIQKANSLLGQRDFTGAEETLRQLVKKFPKDAFAHFQLGNALYLQEKSDSALVSFTEAVKLNPRYALAYNGIGLVYANQERWDDALAQFRKALEINPQYGDALMYMGQVQLQLNKRDEAVALLNKALNIFKSQNRNDRVNRIEGLLRKIKQSDDPSVS